MDLLRQLSLQINIFMSFGIIVHRDLSYCEFIGMPFKIFQNKNHNHADGKKVDMLFSRWQSSLQKAPSGSNLVAILSFTASSGKDWTGQT